MKSIYLFCICIALSTSAFAQLKIKWGASTKLGSSSFSPIYNIPHSTMLTYGLGVFAETKSVTTWLFAHKLAGTEKDTNSDGDNPLISQGLKLLLITYL